MKSVLDDFETYLKVETKSLPSTLTANFSPAGPVTKIYIFTS